MSSEVHICGHTNTGHGDCAIRFPEVPRLEQTRIRLYTCLEKVSIGECGKKSDLNLSAEELCCSGQYTNRAVFHPRQRLLSLTRSLVWPWNTSPSLSAIRSAEFINCANQRSERPRTREIASAIVTRGPLISGSLLPVCASHSSNLSALRRSTQVA